MPFITLTDEQFRVVNAAAGPVDVRDPQGRIVASIDSEFTPEFIAELKRRSAEPGPRFSSAHAIELLATLEREWEGSGGFDEIRLDELVRDAQQVRSQP